MKPLFRSNRGNVGSEVQLPCTELIAKGHELGLTPCIGNKTRQALCMAHADDLPSNDPEVRAMALAAHLLYDRLQALMPHCSGTDALKLELATDMDHVSPEVRNLLGLATIDLMASANQVAASVADAVLGHGLAESEAES